MNPVYLNDGDGYSLDKLVGVAKDDVKDVFNSISYMVFSVAIYNVIVDVYLETGKITTLGMIEDFD